MNNYSKYELFKYAADNAPSFNVSSVSSNEIRFFDYEGKRYVLKTSLMVGENISPFWQMMNYLFGYTFEKQNCHFYKVYDKLKSNPHIQTAKFIFAENNNAVFEYIAGSPINADEFPKGENNAFKLGQYVGYNHREIRKSFGMVTDEKGTDFFGTALNYLDNIIGKHYNGNDDVDRKIRMIFEKVKTIRYEFNGYSLIMPDICANQFLYNGDNIAVCADLDSYVFGPAEWELAFLYKQIEDWEYFKAGYETYQKLPEFEKVSEFFYLLMMVNSYNNKFEIENYWFKYFGQNRL